MYFVLKNELYPDETLFNLITFSKDNKMNMTNINISFHIATPQGWTSVKPKAVFTVS